MDDDYDDDWRPQCRWRGCTDEAETKGFCDAHFETL